MTLTPADDAILAFDAENKVEPAMVIAERIGCRFGEKLGSKPSPSLVSAISHAIEDARELGAKRALATLSPIERNALTLIAGFKDRTLIAPSLGHDGDQGHQRGANRAFNQCADIAIDALATNG